MKVELLVTQNNFMRTVFEYKTDDDEVFHLASLRPYDCIVGARCTAVKSSGETLPPIVLNLSNIYEGDPVMGSAKIFGGLSKLFAREVLDIQSSILPGHHELGGKLVIELTPENKILFEQQLKNELTRKLVVAQEFVQLGFMKEISPIHYIIGH